ncbi:MAG TPA: PepSY-associated TM helix domain-containing protein [Marinagarivorans sp.]|nr:PepSY-associated TM helix domain-containing protein [Marinagarivorans sp.]HNG58961.1 PepSY-associated TM helix domain-containing protein [Cellvibrionaceae bacterium]
MRPFLVRLHRYIGLLIAGFLLLCGFSGALLAWQEELDRWLNPHWYQTSPNHQPRPALDLVEQFEREHPGIEVTSLPLLIKPGQPLKVWVQARPPAAGLGFNQVFIHNQSAQLLGARTWGKVRLDRAHLIPLLYKFHYSLLIPGQWGIWLLGMVAVLWFLDCFSALAISFPRLDLWRKSLRFRLSSGTPKRVFDLHRSSGVWLWLLLTPFACTAISMNLQQELMRPVVGIFSPLAPSPYDRPLPGGELPPLSRALVVQKAQAAIPAGHNAAPASLSCISALNLCSVEFRYTPERLINSRVFLDARDGAITQVQGENDSPGDKFLSLQFALHSGQIAGTPGRLIVTLLGLAIAALCSTGILIAWRKYRARRG